MSERIKYWWRTDLYEVTEDGGIKDSRYPFRRIEFRAPSSQFPRGKERDVIDTKLAKVGYQVSRPLERPSPKMKPRGKYEWRTGSSLHLQHPGEKIGGRVSQQERPLAIGPGPDTPIKSVRGVTVIDWPNGRPKDRANPAPRFLFHGTSLGQYEEMKKAGFDTHKSPRMDSALYLAADPEDTVVYRDQASATDGTPAIVIKLDLNELEKLGELDPDWTDVDAMIRDGDWPDESVDDVRDVTWEESLAVMGTISYEGPFGPAIVEVIETDNPESRKKLRARLLR